MAELHRVQLLIEVEQREALAEIAAREGRSVSDVAREMIRAGLEQRRRSRERWRDAIGRLDAIRERQRGTVAYDGDPVAEAREERIGEFERVWRGES